jgi:hypothetical protein
MTARRGRGFRRIFTIAFAVLLHSTLPATAALAGDATGGYDFTRRPDVAPLLGAREWVLTGTKLANGACRYRYPDVSAVPPESGWAIRSIGVDMDKCAKLMEEGIPTSLPETPKGGTLVELGGDGLAADTEGEQAAVASTRAAWQKVVWSDLINLPVNWDATEIEWTYSGGNVTSGNVSGWVWGSSATHWQIVYAYHEQFLHAQGDFFRGNTWSKFKNDWFCWPLPTVYTYYYYNKMWGHPDGTATRSQSSDSVDECLILHFDAYSAYGQFNP